MKKIAKPQTELSPKWQFTQGKHARTIWIDGPLASRKSRKDIEKARKFTTQRMNQRLI